MIYIKRLLGLPFYAGILAIGLICVFFRCIYLWMRYGGEAVVYNSKMNRKSLSDVFYAVKEKLS